MVRHGTEESSRFATVPGSWEACSRACFTLALLSLVIATWISFSRFVAGKSEKVPNFTNLSVDEATSLAAERELAVSVDVAGGLRRRVPARRVRAQSPAPDAAVKSGQTVRVFLSLGPRQVRMPDLTGLTRAHGGARARERRPKEATLRPRACRGRPASSRRASRPARSRPRTLRSTFS
jgi:hypothetical protein